MKKNLKLIVDNTKKRPGSDPHKPTGGAALRPYINTKASSTFLVEIPKQPLEEVQVLQEIYRLQQLIMCSNLPEKNRFIMASAIDAALMMLERDMPRFIREHRFINRQNLIS